MTYPTKRTTALAAAILLAASAVWAGQWDVSKEIAEGSREIRRERQEARREILSADSPREAAHEIREGAREVSREKREKRREVSREMRQAW
jgi:hypothetical protein